MQGIDSIVKSKQSNRHSTKNTGFRLPCAGVVAATAVAADANNGCNSMIPDDLHQIIIPFIQIKLSCLDWLECWAHGAIPDDVDDDGF